MVLYRYRYLLHIMIKYNKIKVRGQYTDLIMCFGPFPKIYSKAWRMTAQNNTDNQLIKHNIIYYYYIYSWKSGASDVQIIQKRKFFVDKKKYICVDWHSISSYTAVYVVHKKILKYLFLE